MGVYTLSISSYSKVYNLGHRAVVDIFNEGVLIEEKIDGSQFSFCVIDGELLCRSHGKQIVLDAPEKMFYKAIAVIQGLKDKLHDGYIYRGEFLGKPCHNSLAYNRTPEKNIIIYDIDKGEQDYLSYEEKKKECDRIGLEVVPILHEGIVTLEKIKDLLNTESVLGGCKIEGFVVKNYKRFTIDGKTMMGKYVSEAFKETHKHMWREKNPTKGDIIQRLIDDYRTDARWNKAIQHLREEGKLKDAPEDIGSLLKELQNDLVAECGIEIKELLYQHFIGDIKRGVMRGFPEFYKEHLLKKQFGGQNEN
jgi:hypothetical protein